MSTEYEQVLLGLLAEQAKTFPPQTFFIRHESRITENRERCMQVGGNLVGQCDAVLTICFTLTCRLVGIGEGIFYSQMSESACASACVPGTR
jgi:hypothetical protein